MVYSADKGEKLHEINTGLRFGMGPPVTYMVDGKQYVTLTGGRGLVVAPPAAAGAGTATGTGAAAPPATGPQGGAPDAGRGGAASAEPVPIVPPKILTFALDGGAK